MTTEHNVELPAQVNEEPISSSWYRLTVEETAKSLGADITTGLSTHEARSRLATYGENVITPEPSPSGWRIAMGQLRDPMNVMLVVVAIASFAIGETGTGILVAALVLLNVVMGTRQELKAKASVDALADMQIPVTRVIRNGSLVELPATELVPGDLIQLEAGDLVPADGRLVRSATLETQEAALTGESAPIPKSPDIPDGLEVALGDRTDLVFQNTSVTRGTASALVTETGMRTEMGRIAGMLAAVERTKSPLQKELDSLTKILGVIAWSAVALIVAIGLARGLEWSDLLLLGTAMAISAIPTGLPTFVQGMLSYGARQLADAKAVVKNLTDVETLGATSAINSDKTGTLTLNKMTASKVWFRENWYTVEGGGYDKNGAILGVAGQDTPDFTNLALGLTLASDATVSDVGEVVGDPTEAALVVLAAKVGVDAPETRREYPRVAEVPFDSAYKFMATFHHLEVEGEQIVGELVKGAPDVILKRCSSAADGGGLGSGTPIAEAQAGITAAVERMSSEGLRVLSFAARVIPEDQEELVESDPMALVEELVFVALVGIIDPLRPASKEAVTVALAAGIEVRMITGDHAVTAKAIADDLGLGEGVITGAEFSALSDTDVLELLPDLHVFGRVSPEDKLRLVDLMQTQGDIVAMTGDAVNDAAALKQADIGVAMGSGSEVSKQAARMILTDDNFGTLVHAIELGRSIYAKVVSYVRFQMSQLFSLVMLFVTASVFGINDGVALTPLMVLFLNFFVAVGPVVAIMVDETPPGIMSEPPRDPNVGITNPAAVSRWVGYGATLFLATLVPLLFGPDELRVDAPSASMTMAFVVIGFGTVLSGLVMRRDPESGLSPPILRTVGILAIPAFLVIMAVETAFLQRALGTMSLTGGQWLVSASLSLVIVVVVGADKWIRRVR